jgi:hypothetical protein
MPPVPPKPQTVSYDTGEAIIAWLGTFPIGTTFRTYWEAGDLVTVPSQPFTNQFGDNLKSKTDSIRAGNGINTIPDNTNIYVAVTSVSISGVESAQSPALYLPICNADDADSVTVARDEAHFKKLLLTDDKGRLQISGSTSISPAVEDAILEIRDALVGVFGNDYQISVDDSTQTITGTTAFQVAMAFTPVVCASGPFSGIYKISWSSEFSHDIAGGDTEVRLIRTDIGPIEIGYNEEQAADSDDWNTFSGSTTVALISENPSFDLEFRTAQVGQTALIRRIRLEWYRVA